jgi:TldD protein
MREMGEVLLDANAQLQLKASHVQSRRATYFRDWQEVLVAASDGTFARDIRLTQSVGYNLLCADGANRSSIAQRAGSTSEPGFLRSWEYQSAAEEVAESAGKMLYADYVESGTYPIIMANEFGGSSSMKPADTCWKPLKLRRKNLSLRRQKRRKNCP